MMSWVRAQVSERDDRLLTDQLLALEKANQEVAGDEDSEGEEPEGMCAPCQGFIFYVPALCAVAAVLKVCLCQLLYHSERVQVIVNMRA